MGGQGPPARWLDLKSPSATLWRAAGLGAVRLGGSGLDLGSESPRCKSEPPSQRVSELGQTRGLFCASRPLEDGRIRPHCRR